MVDIAIQGICGRMGAVLRELIDGRDDCRIVAGVDKADCGATLPFPVVPGAAALAGLAQKPDVLIDFSHPDATKEALDYCGAAGLPIVVCTTGLPDDVRALLEATAAKTAVFFSANMSLGINLLAELVKQAQAMLPGFDVEIVEKHHRAKLDAPSGTALMLADAVNEQAEGRYQYIYNRQDRRQKRGDDELGISAVRGGSIVGEHEVIFAGPDEVVTLSHTAYSRGVFANGAVCAALFMAGKGPGLYSMKEIVKQI